MIEQGFQRISIPAPWLEESRPLLEGMDRMVA